jgi:hypothetical protein
MVGDEAAKRARHGMNDSNIVTAFVVIEDRLILMNHPDDCRAEVSA